MPYTVVKSFERGIDTRRLVETTELGGLIDAKDCHTTRGGEIEKRAAFVVLMALPSSTIGFYAQTGGTFHTWGDDETAPVGLPAGVVYHSIPSPIVPPETEQPVLTHILAVEEFQGKLYVIAEYTTPSGNVSIIHWFDDEIIAIKAGTGGDVEPDPDDPDSESGPVDPPPSPQSGAKASCTFDFEVDATQLPKGMSLSDVLLSPPTTAGGPSVHLIDVAVAPYKSSSSQASVLCQVIQMKVNAWPATPPVSCQASGNSITFWMNDEGALYNNWTITIVQSGWAAITNGATQTLSGGLDRIGGGSLGGRSFDAPLPGMPREGAAGEPLRLGTNALAHESKMYAANGTKLNISGFENATAWDADVNGSGEINFEQIAEGTPIILAMADFLGDLAIFCLRHIMIWAMDVDPRKNVKKQILHRSGLIAPHGLVPYAEADVMYLDRSGIRSLRTRSGVDQAFAADLGTRIDDLVRVKIAASTDDDKRYHFWAEVEPRSGRLWMGLKDIIYVLSYYPDSSIAGWSYYDASAHPIDYLNANEDNIFWRSGDDVIAYGGLLGTTYDATECVVRVPYIDGGKLATSKNWQGVDAAAFGTWQIKASFDPTLPTALDLIANITKSTYAQQKIAMNGESPAVSLEFRSTYVGAAKVGNATVHYTESTAD